MIASAPKPRRFITLEGGEGAGKSTQARLLAERLRGTGADVVVTREPGGAPFAERLRKAILAAGSMRPGALAEALAFYAARADHLEQTIKPALARGAWVVCDRFNDSTRVYQGAAGGLSVDVLRQLDTIVVGACRPTVTLVLHVDPSVGFTRVAERRGTVADTSTLADMYEAEDRAFHDRLAEGFRQLTRDEPERCKLIDARGDVDAVANAAWVAVVNAFNLA